MVIVRGLENPATACHVSCPVIILAYALRPLAQALVTAGPLLQQQQPTPSAAFWDSWTRVLEHLLAEDDDEGDTSTTTVQEFYQHVETAAGIRVGELGDAVTSLIKLLTLLRDHPILAKVTNTALYTGRVKFAMRGLKYDCNSWLRRTKWTNEKALSVPFQVACSTLMEAEPASLEQALKRTLSPRPVEGCQWSGNYEEVVVSVDEKYVPSHDGKKNEEWQNTRQLSIRALPPFWLVHVDHFASIDGRVQSQQRSCGIPLRLDAATLCQLDNSADQEYRLVGAILHLSNQDARKEEEEDGHYVSIVKSDEFSSEEWVLVDDSSTTLVTEETCLNLLAGCETNLSENGTFMQACLLVYENVKASTVIEPMIQDLWGQVEEARQQGKAVIGRRLKVLWGKGRFYEGVVASFDHRTGKHVIRYDDGDVRSYNLSKKTIEWL
eukprot:scaffold1581_cov169-Amphora_coffeaeformis.AAC.15